jgi:Outer membrane protein beta-barrel domain
MIMKKFIFAFVFGGLVATVATAQVGIKAGVNFATMAEEGEDVSRGDIENKSIAGAVVGLTFDLNVSDIITIQPELMFSQSGGSNTYNVLGTVTKSQYKINYLELPVLAKVQFGNANQDGLGFHIAAGPWIGYALSGNYNSKTTFNEDVLFEIDRDYTFDDEDDTKRLNYGLIGAAGLSFGHLVFDLRYNYGLNNLLDDDADNTNDNKPVLQTRGVALTLGYTF